MRTARLALALACACTAAAAAAQPAPPPNPDLLSAIRRLEAGDPEAALVTLNALLRSADPLERPQLYLNVGIAHSLLNAEGAARGAFAAALDLDRSLSLDPDRWPPRAIRLLEAARSGLPPVPRPSLDPNVTDVAGLYEGAERLRKAGYLPEAEAALRRLADLHPKDRQACAVLAGFLNSPLWDGKSRVEETLATAERCATLEPKNSEGYLVVAKLYWDHAYRGPQLDDAQKDRYADKGLEFVDRAIRLDADNWEAVIYKGLLKRVKAMVTRDEALRDAYMKEAQALQRQAVEIKKRKTPGSP